MSKKTTKTADKVVVKKIKTDEKTSKRVATIAAKKLQDPNTPKDVLSMAGSLVTQAPDKVKPAPTKKKKG